MCWSKDDEKKLKKVVGLLIKIQQAEVLLM